MKAVSITTSAPQTMSTREIAELTGKLHRNVIRDFEKQCADLGEDVLKFEHIYTDSYGREQKQYLLDKEQTLTLITGYRTDLRHKIVKRWMELEGVTPSPVVNALSETNASLLLFQQAHGVLSAVFKNMDQNALVLASDNACRNTLGVSVLAITGLTHLPAPSNERTVIPTDIGKELGLNARIANHLLAANGLQKRNAAGKWEPTEKGKPYARFFDTGKAKRSGAAVQQLKWLSSVIPLLKA